MITSVTEFVSSRVQALISQVRGFEESGHIGIDCISLNTREQLQEYGVL